MKQSKNFAKVFGAKNCNLQQSKKFETVRQSWHEGKVETMCKKSFEMRSWVEVNYEDISLCCRREKLFFTQARAQLVRHALRAVRHKLSPKGEQLKWETF